MSASLQVSSELERLSGLLRACSQSGSFESLCEVLGQARSWFAENSHSHLDVGFWVGALLVIASSSDGQAQRILLRIELDAWRKLVRKGVLPGRITCCAGTCAEASDLAQTAEVGESPPA